MLLALLRRLAFEQGGENAERAEQSGGQVRDGMPTRTGPWPGRPVIDISPPMPWAIWSKPGRFS